MNKDAIIYFEDTIDSGIYVIKSGKVELKKEEGYFLDNGALKRTITLVEGDVFGFEENFLHIKRINRATAVEDCELLRFEQNEFEKVIKDNRKIGEKILSSLSGKIRSINEKIKTISFAKNQNITGIESEDEKIKEIYLHFFKNSDFVSAGNVLSRMELYTKYQEYAEIERKRLNFIENKAVNTESYNEFMEVFEKSKPEVFAFVLEKVLNRVGNRDLREKLIFTLITALQECKQYEKLLREAEAFFEEFPKSKKTKKILFIMLEVYQKIEDFSQALKTAYKLADMIETADEFTMLANTIAEIQNRV